MRIAVYSGSFNPLHIGHQAIMDYLTREKEYDWVYLVVSPKNPIKTTISADTAEARYKAAIEAVKRHPELHVWVDDIELRMPPPQYTIKTLDALKQREPENDFNAIRTLELAYDLNKVELNFENNNWKVAQLYAYGEPVMEYFDDGFSHPRFYPWNGETPPFLISGNEGYQIYLCQHGIIVKSNFDEGSANVYDKLVRDENGVSGITKDETVVKFTPLMGRYPEWDANDPHAYGELRFLDMKASEVFRDTLNMLTVFTEIARNSKTGFSLNII